MKTFKFLSSLLLLLSFFPTGFSQPSVFYPHGIGGGGSLYFPSVNPADDNEFYVSCDMSEMFHSTDFGNTYSQVDFTKLQVGGVSTYEFTKDPDIAYCIVNDGNNYYPVKTTDGGNSWITLSSYDLGTYGDACKMKANYNDPSQLLIGGYGDILISRDGGSSFSLVRHAANMGAGLILGGVFWDGSSIYIGTNEGILSSSNGGASFSILPVSGIEAGQVLWNFAGAKTGNNIRFACITANSGDVYNGLMPWDYYNFAKGVYVMDNANGTWVSRSAGINFSSDFIMYLTMAWNDIQTIYLGGNDNLLFAPLVYKSANGGTTWIKVFNTTNNANIITGWEGYNGDKNWSWSETCFGITAAPDNSAKVMFSTYSNVEVSSNGGDSWKQAYISNSDEHPAGNSTPKNQPYHSIGLENTSCWQVFWQDANTMMGCFSDIGGIRSTDAGHSWGFEYTGFSVNSLYRMVKGNNGFMYGGCSNIHDIYESTRLKDTQLDASDGNGKIVYSADNGATWSTLRSFGHPVFWLAIDPNNPNRMYASVIHYGGTQGAQLGGIYRTDDLNALASATWTKLPDPPRTEGHPACIDVLNDGKVVCSFSGRINPGGAFTASSGVFLYDPALNAWTDVSDNGMHYWTRDVVIDPGDASQNTWYAGVYSGWGGPPNGLGGLYKTTNRGTSWTKLTGSEFDRVTSITFNPQNIKQAYLTTETQGLWVSGDMNNSLPTWSLVASYPFRQPERVFFNPYNTDEMWVSSFGNGMKSGSMTSSGISDPQNSAVSGMKIFPNPSDGEFTLISEKPFQKSVFRVMDATGRIVLARDPDPGNYSQSFHLNQLAEGLYIWTVSDGRAILGQGKLIIVK